ncbi:hypothetical protein EON76_05150 [bacterium]|nr:MAG: hypothetical protein EON76_05150 [bacterium]
MKLKIEDREDLSAVFVSDENDETVLCEVICNFDLMRQMVKRFNEYDAMWEALKHARAVVAANCDGIYEVGVLEDIDQVLGND